MGKTEYWQDFYSGDDKEVRGAFPDMKPNKNRHEHYHHEGGLYNHIHPHGAVPHYHDSYGETAIEEDYG